MKLFQSLIIICCLLGLGNKRLTGTGINPGSTYTEYEVQLDTGSYAIHGSLIMPINATKVPVALIIGGSGPTDRNGNNPAGLSTDCYKLMAQGLAENGIASLRYDKRGVAASMKSGYDESRLVIGTYIDDAEKWVKWLRKDSRFGKVIIAGHGEGALIGCVAANFSRADGFISIEGAGVRADSLLIRQIAFQSAALADTAKVIIDHINRGEQYHVNSNLSGIFRPSVSLYLKSWFQLSPVIEISILRCPVLIIHGTTDLQVSVENARSLAEARPYAKLLLIDRMNYVMKTASDDPEENLQTYGNSSLPLSPELIPAISAFVHAIK